MTQLGAAVCRLKAALCWPTRSLSVVLSIETGRSPALSGESIGDARFILVENWFTELRQRMGSN